jgi:hypothetical protein
MQSTSRISKPDRDEHTHEVGVLSCCRRSAGPVPCVITEGWELLMLSNGRKCAQYIYDWIGDWLWVFFSYNKIKVFLYSEYLAIQLV